MIKKNNKAGRPVKSFKLKPKENIKRSRGRPKKHDLETRKNQGIINSIIKKTKRNKLADNVSLGLMISGILLFIFAILIKINGGTNEKEIIREQTNIVQQANENTINTNETKKDINEVKTKEQNETVRPLSNEEALIYNFYEKINNKDFDSLGGMVDSRLKTSDIFKTYYNENWIVPILENLESNRLYMVSINEINSDKSTTKKFSYEIKYKLTNSNELFTEKWNTIIVYKNDKPLIGSIMCISTGCSKNPFFNPQRYGIR